MTIEEAELSVRLYNALRWCNIETIEETRRMTDRELMRIKNFGKKCLQELRGIQIYQSGGEEWAWRTFLDV